MAPKTDWPPVVIYLARRDAARAITDRQLQELAAVAPRAQLRLAHQQYLSDLAAVDKFPHLHRRAKIEWRADGKFAWIAAQL